MNIVERMQDAIQRLRERTSGKRHPKAFYLGPDDWSEFMATNPPRIRTMWGNNPPTMIEDPALGDVPVRESTSKQSRLYDNTGAGRTLLAD